MLLDKKITTIANKLGNRGDLVAWGLWVRVYKNNTLTRACLGFCKVTVGACDYLKECLTQLCDHWLAISRFVFESPPGILYLIACKALDYIDKVKSRLRTVSSSNIKPQDIRVQLMKLMKTYLIIP